MLKRMIKSLRQRFCKHDFRQTDTEYNRTSKQIGCGNAISYKCSKCGKIVWLKY